MILDETIKTGTKRVINAYSGGTKGDTNLEHVLRVGTKTLLAAAAVWSGFVYLRQGYLDLRKPTGNSSRGRF